MRMCREIVPDKPLIVLSLVVADRPLLGDVGTGKPGMGEELQILRPGCTKPARLMIGATSKAFMARLEVILIDSCCRTYLFDQTLPC